MRVVFTFKNFSYLFTIQNVPIKFELNEISQLMKFAFTIQNVPIKKFQAMLLSVNIHIYNTKCSY